MGSQPWTRVVICCMHTILLHGVIGTRAQHLSGHSVIVCGVHGRERVYRCTFEDLSVPKTVNSSVKRMIVCVQESTRVQSILLTVKSRMWGTDYGYASRTFTSNVLFTTHSLYLFQGRSTFCFLPRQITYTRSTDMCLLPCVRKSCLQRPGCLHSILNNGGLFASNSLSSENIYCLVFGNNLALVIKTCVSFANKGLSSSNNCDMREMSKCVSCSCLLAYSGTELLRTRKIVDASEPFFSFVTEYLETRFLWTLLLADMWSCRVSERHMKKNIVVFINARCKNGLDFKYCVQAEYHARCSHVTLSYRSLQDIALATNKSHVSVQVCVIKFSNADSGKISVLREDGENSILIERTLISDVVSVSVSDVHSTPLTEPIMLVFAHHMTPASSGSVHCVFWDSISESWSERGCYVLSFNTTHTSCQCDHLTSFAILAGEGFNTMSSEVQSWLTQLLSVASIICHVLSFATFVYFPSLQCHRNTIHKNLVASLAVGQTLFSIGISLTESPVFCSFVAVMLHYIFLSAFFWMLLEGMQLYLMLLQPSKSTGKGTTFFFAYGFGYGMPILILITSFSANYTKYGTANYCWLSTEDGVVWAFMFPVLCVLTLNTIMFGLSVWVMLKHSKTSQMMRCRSKLERNKTYITGTLTIASVLGIFWWLAFLHQTGLEIFSYLFIIFNAPQGVTIFVLHCLMNDKVVDQYRFLFRRFTFLPAWLNCFPMLSDESTHQSHRHAQTSRRRGTIDGQPMDLDGLLLDFQKAGGLTMLLENERSSEDDKVDGHPKRKRTKMRKMFEWIVNTSAKTVANLMGAELQAVTEEVADDTVLEVEEKKENKGWLGIIVQTVKQGFGPDDDDAMFDTYDDYKLSNVVDLHDSVVAASERNRLPIIEQDTLRKISSRKGVSLQKIPQSYSVVRSNSSESILHLPHFSEVEMDGRQKQFYSSDNQLSNTAYKVLQYCSLKDVIRADMRTLNSFLMENEPLSRGSSCVDFAEDRDCWLARAITTPAVRSVHTQTCDVLTQTGYVMSPDLHESSSLRIVKSSSFIWKQKAALHADPKPRTNVENRPSTSVDTSCLFKGLRSDLSLTSSEGECLLSVLFGEPHTTVGTQTEDVLAIARQSLISADFDKPEKKFFNMNLTRIKIQLPGSSDDVQLKGTELTGGGRRGTRASIRLVLTTTSDTEESESNAFANLQNIYQRKKTDAAADKVSGYIGTQLTEKFRRAVCYLRIAGGGLFCRTRRTSSSSPSVRKTVPSKTASTTAESYVTYVESPASETGSPANEIQQKRMFSSVRSLFAKITSRESQGEEEGFSCSTFIAPITSLFARIKSCGSHKGKKEHEEIPPPTDRPKSSMSVPVAGHTVSTSSLKSESPSSFAEDD